MDAVEWEKHKQTLTVAKANHVPMDPPSFPVMAASCVAFDGMAHHTFIEVHELKQLLGLS